MTYSEILARLEVVTGFAPRRSGDGHEALCPAHDDKTPSFTLSQGDDGRTLVHCQRGCSFDAVAQALDLEAADFYVRDDNAQAPAPPWDPKSDGSVTTATYVYADADGSTLFEKLRREPKPDHPAHGRAKSFTQRRRDGGRWVYNLRGVERPLYRLPSVLEAVAAGRLVFVVEGEKDADRLAALDLVATCNDGGAGKWGPQHTAALEGAHVVVIPDNDPKGREHAGQVCTALEDIATSIRVFNLEALPDGRAMPTKGDVSDWLDAGGTPDGLKDLVRALPQRGQEVEAEEIAPHALTDSARRPTVPERVYTLLPPALGDATSRFDRWAERDAFLTSVLVCLSGALPHVRFRYGRHYLSPHLSGFLYGPAASGKGVVTLARAWLHGIDDALTAASTATRDAWLAKKDDRDRLRRSRKKADQDELRLLDETDPLGSEPPLRYLLVGEDTTSAGLVDGLHYNAEGVTLVSTEADTLTDANGKEHGRYSSLIRKAFHNERHSENRRGGGRLVIPAARLSLLLAGTLDQVDRMFEGGVEDGLFSRFIFYALGGTLRYESQREVSEDIEFDAMTAARATDALGLHRALAGRDIDAEGQTAPLYVDLPRDAWDRMDEAFGDLFDRVFGGGSSADPGLAATVKRGPVICYRLAVVLAVWRAFGAGVDLRAAPSLTISDDDAEAALLLSLVYAENALRRARTYGARYAVRDDLGLGGAHRMEAEDREAFDAVPERFSTADLVAAGMPQATAYRRVKEWAGDAGLVLEDGKEGRTKMYRKVPRPTPTPFVGDGIASEPPTLTTPPDLDVPASWGEEPPF